MGELVVCAFVLLGALVFVLATMETIDRRLRKSDQERPLELVGDETEEREETTQWRIR